MRTIYVHRDRVPNGKGNGMTAKEWDAKTKLLELSAFKRSIRVKINREIRNVIKERLARLEERRQEAMRNWAKQP